MYKKTHASLFYKFLTSNFSANSCTRIFHNNHSQPVACSICCKKPVQEKADTKNQTCKFLVQVDWYQIPVQVSRLCDISISVPRFITHYQSPTFMSISVKCPSTTSSKSNSGEKTDERVCAECHRHPSSHQIFKFSVSK